MLAATHVAQRGRPQPVAGGRAALPGPGGDRHLPHRDLRRRAALLPTAARARRRSRSAWPPTGAPTTTRCGARLARVRALHGEVHLLDAHSIHGTVPRLFAGRLPDLNYGTDDGRSAAPALVARALAADRRRRASARCWTGGSAAVTSPGITARRAWGPGGDAQGGGVHGWGARMRASGRVARLPG